LGWVYILRTKMSSAMVLRDFEVGMDQIGVRAAELMQMADSRGLPH
jgi:hypothetical protein